MYIVFGFTARNSTKNKDGTINIESIFNTISANSFPHTLEHFVIVIGLGGDKSEKGNHDATISLMGPDQNQIGDSSIHNIELLRTKNYPINPTCNLFVNVEKAVFSDEGLHEFAVMVDGIQIGSIPLLVSKKKR